MLKQLLKSLLNTALTSASKQGAQPSPAVSSSDDALADNHKSGSENGKSSKSFDNLIIDQSLLPNIERPVYYSFNSDESGLEAKSVASYRDEHGNSVYKITVAEADAGYFGIGNRSVVDASLSYWNSDLQRIEAGVSFGTAKQHVSADGLIYVVGDGEIFDHR